MLVFIQINGPLGPGYGASFTLSTIPAGVITPATVDTIDLLNGIVVDVPDATAAILATSTSDTSCTILITISTTSTTSTTSSTTSTSSTTTTTTVPSVICFAFETEAGPSSNIYYDIASSGNIPPVNGKPAYDFSGLFGYPATIYFNGTEWVYDNSDLGGVIQMLSSANDYPISDAITLPIWTPNCNGCGFQRLINKSTFGSCPTTTTTSSTTTSSTTTSSSTTSSTTTSSTSTSTTSSTTSTTSTSTTTTQNPCCSPIINSIVVAGAPTGLNYPIQVNYTVPTVGCNTCFSMEFRVDTTGTGTGWNSWSAMPANACTQTLWQLPFSVPNNTLVQLRIISIGGICPASAPFAFVSSTTTSTTTVPPCIPGVNTCTPIVNSYTPNSVCGLTTDVAVVSTSPFGSSTCNQTIGYNIFPNNCKCVVAVFLDHRSVNWVSWTQSSPVAFTPSGFINVCNLLSLYNNIVAAAGNPQWTPTSFEIRLRVVYTDGSTATSPTYLIMPNIEYQNITTSAQVVSGWASGQYCNNWINNQFVAPGDTICIQGSLNGNTSAFNAIGFC